MRVLAITGGHRVDLDAFRGLLAAIRDERGWVFAHAVQPEAQGRLSPEHRGAVDAILCHDIPGLVLKRGTAPHFRRLLSNALAWVASPGAHDWAVHHRALNNTARKGTPWISS